MRHGVPRPMAVRARRELWPLTGRTSFRIPDRPSDSVPLIPNRIYFIHLHMSTCVSGLTKDRLARPSFVQSASSMDPDPIRRPAWSTSYRSVGSGCAVAPAGAAAVTTRPTAMAAAMNRFLSCLMSIPSEKRLYSGRLSARRGQAEHATKQGDDASQTHL